jgi:hypothetical protein
MIGENYVIWAWLKIYENIKKLFWNVCLENGYMSKYWHADIIYFQFNRFNHVLQKQEEIRVDTAGNKTSEW